MSLDLHAVLGRELLGQPLMRQALTHRSAGSNHNERLEFLGDAVLGVIISGLVYHRFPLFTEGELTRLRSYLVREGTLAEVASAAGLTQFIIVGPGEVRYVRDALLADTLEAVIGALYLLEGIKKASEFVSKIFGDRLVNAPSPDALKDPKTRLQEYLQGGGRARPIYELREETADGIFHVACKVADFDIEVTSRAASKRKAEQQAAAGVLEQLPPA